MRDPEFGVGAAVTHAGHDGRVGLVVDVRRRGWWPFRYWVYCVRWRKGTAPVPVSHGLWRVQAVGAARHDDSEGQAPSEARP